MLQLLSFSVQISYSSLTPEMWTTFQKITLRCSVLTNVFNQAPDSDRREDLQNDLFWGLQWSWAFILWSSNQCLLKVVAQNWRGCLEEGVFSWMRCFRMRYPVMPRLMPSQHRKVLHALKSAREDESECNTVKITAGKLSRKNRGSLYHLSFVVVWP